MKFPLTAAKFRQCDNKCLRWNPTYSYKLVMKTSAVENKIWAAKKNRVSVVGTVNFLVWYVNDCVVVVEVGGGVVKIQVADFSTT